MMSTAIYIVMGILLLALLLTVIRLIKGPSTSDRIVSLDMIGYVLIGIIICLSIIKDNRIFLDAILIISLILFVGTVSMSKYLTENVAKNGDRNNNSSTLR